MISKELLSEVLGYEVTNIKSTSYPNCLCYETTNEDIRRYFSPTLPIINIYELMSKCKEWIINKGYVLRICYVLENDTRELCFVETTLLKSNQYLQDYYDMDSNTEVEVIFKACEWILKEIRK